MRLSSAITAFHVVRARWALLMLALLYVYLTVHMVSGSQGLSGWAEAEAEAERLSREVAALRVEREALADEARALASGNPEIDVLDMRARERLFASREGELVLQLPR